jgi:hypothetical protein
METTLQEAGVFITLEDSGEINHRWSERQASYRETSWYRVSPLSPYRLWSQLQENLQGLARGL